jgi:DNA-directed RNA polymerase specialized sigma24 family protein
MAPPADRSPAAFEALYDAAARRLLVSLTRRTQDVDVARELWAECWAAAFEGWPRCRARGTAAQQAWVFGIARRRLADYWRSGAIERRAVGLRIVDGLSYAEVAARLNCSEDAARAHVSRGLRGLQRVIERPQGA